MGRSDYRSGSSEISDFFRYINERDAIWHRREKGQDWPWTEDPILQEWSFCNVFRERDSGTVALRCLIGPRCVPSYRRQPNVELLNDEAKLEVLRNILVYRLWNLEEHAQEHGWITDLSTFIEYIRQRRRDGRKVFSAAYMMTSAGQSMDKAELFIGAMKTLWEMAPDIPINSSLEETSIWLSKNVYLVGRFVAQEMVQDLRQIKGFLYDATDTLKWAHAGPGAHRGLDRLGLPVGSKWSLESMRALLGHAPHYLSDALQPHLPKQLGGKGKYPIFDLHVIEFNLCEFDKYERCRLDQGRPRRRYKGVPRA